MSVLPLPAAPDTSAALRPVGECLSWLWMPFWWTWAEQLGQTRGDINSSALPLTHGRPEDRS